jgi:hypothetical protein
VRAEDPGGLCAFVRKTWGERRFRRVEVLRLGGGWQLSPELYDEAARFLRRDMAISWGNAMTLIKLGRLYIRNAVKNLSLLPGAADISALDFGAAPLLVLGAGPSLDALLRGLLERFGEAAREPATRPFRIIAADTSLPCLRERGIRPDLAVILESQHWNLGDFVGSRGWGIPAAMDLSAQPESSRVLGAGVFLFATEWTDLRLFGRLERAGLLPSPLTPLGSVGPAAAALALRSGRGPVLTGGIDFSFTLDSYHARSSPGRLSRLAGATRFLSLINPAPAFRRGTFRSLSKAGHPVRSDPAMRGYRDLFEEEFSGEARLRDILGPGLPLGVQTLSPEEAFNILADAASDRDAAPATDAAALPPRAVPPSPPPSARAGSPPRRGVTPEALRAFAEEEKARLIRLREILSGEKTPAGERAGEEAGAREGETERLLDECDYLWAHFPECAGGNRGPAGQGAPAGDLSFLKRVRAEIDPFVKLWEFVLAGTDESPTREAL